MQKLKFENNKIITHRYNVFLFSPLLTVSYCFPLPQSPKFWDYRHVPLQPDYSSTITSSLNFIQMLWVNGRFCQWREKRG